MVQPAEEPKTQETKPKNGQAKEETSHQALPVLTKPSDERAILPFSSVAAFEAAQRMAKALASSSLVPAAYQGDKNIPNVLIAMEMASRIGASIFMVMQNLDVIHGTPGWRGKFLIATVNTCGRFTPLQFEWRSSKGKGDWGCRAVATEIKTGKVLQGSWIDWDMVTAEGWSSKNGSKWKTMAEQMFMYRAGAFWSRAYAPEIALGMSTAEELEDVGPTDVPTAISNAPVSDLEAQIRAKTETKAAPPSEPAKQTPAPRRRSAEKPPESKPEAKADAPKEDPKQVSTNDIVDAALDEKSDADESGID